MIRPDRKVLEAAARLQGNPDFDAIINWIVSSEQLFLRDLVMSKDTEDMLRAQGGCQVLADIKSHVVNARDSLSKTGR